MTVEEKRLVDIIDRSRLPKHIAIIMDGNGRWARSKGLPRHAGHAQGAEIVLKTCDACVDLGNIEVLTFYAFSTENWKRPREETDLIMRLIKEFLERNIERMNKRNIRMRAMGRIEELPGYVREAIKTTEESTRSNGGLIVNLAINYSGRDDILSAVKNIVSGGIDYRDIDEKTFRKYLHTTNCSEVDLLIRTAGDYRLSNFMLWELAYAEIYVTDVMWPEFEPGHFFKAIIEYQKRTRHE